MPHSTPSHHPFLDGHHWRTDELGDAVVTSAHWRWTTWAALLGWLFTGSIWGVREMVRAPIKVAMVAYDTEGTTRLLGFLPGRYAVTDAVRAKEVRTFVEILRRVTSDKVMMGEDWDARKGIYGRVTPQGRKLLDHYVQVHGNPLTRKDLVMVEVVRNLPRGKHTRDVSWIERRFSAELEPMETTRYSGLLSYEERTPRTEAELTANPAGVWLDQWSFSKDQ